MAGCSEGGTAVSGRARALNESNPAHSKRAPSVAATFAASRTNLAAKSATIPNSNSELNVYYLLLFFF